MIQRSAAAMLCALSVTAGCASNPFPAPTASSKPINQSRSQAQSQPPSQASSQAQPALASKRPATQKAKVVQASANSSDHSIAQVTPAAGLQREVQRASESEVTMAALVAQDSLQRRAASSPPPAVAEAPVPPSSAPRRSVPVPTPGEPVPAGSAPAAPPTTQLGETLPAAASPAVTSSAAASSVDARGGLVQLNLDNVLQMAEAQNPQIAVARERINEAYARALQAGTAWLPSLRAGINYNHHEGAIQDVAGNVFQTNRSAMYGGFGANAVGAASPAVPGMLAQFHFADALFQPAIADHQAAARQFGATAVRNDTLRDTAVAYLELVRAEHASRITLEAVENTQNLSSLTQQFAEVGQGLNSDYTRMQAELAIRRTDLLVQQEAVQVASARLAELLHADAGVLITSGEPTIAPLDILNAEEDTACLVADGLLRRPELAEQKHLVSAAVERLRREQYAPLVPSVLLGVSYGAMGGGLGSTITNTEDRWDADAIAYWELRNLGLGEQAARRETASVARQARLRKIAMLDQVAREVVEAHAQVNQRRQRIAIAEEGIAAAEKSYRLNWERIENAQGLPIEVLQSVQALTAARRAYLDAVTDYNIAQFQLCYATGVLVR